MGSNVSALSYDRLKSQDSEEREMERDVQSEEEGQASDTSATDAGHASTW